MGSAGRRLLDAGDDATCVIVKLLLDHEDPQKRREGHAAVMQAPVPIAVFEGRDHRLRLANHAWRPLGIEGVVGEPIQERGLRARLDRAFEAEVSDHFAELKLPSGPAGGELERFYAGVISPMRSERGGSRGVIVACSEVTDEVLARRLVADPRAMVWSGLGSDPPDYVNRCGLAYTAATAASWQGVVHRDDLAPTTQATASAVDGRDAEVDVRIRRRDGSYRWHRVRFVAIRSERAATRWFGVAVEFHDAHELAVELAVSRKREAEAQASARRAKRHKELFLASASHELRAPITTMLLWEKVMRDAPTDPELRSRALDAIRQSAMTQSQLVADLLDVARSASGKFHVELRPIEIGPILDDALDASEPLAAGKHQHLVRHIDKGLGQVCGDPHRLRQILDNLLANAIKFTEPHGRIGVFARCDGANVVIELSDTGRGISPEFLPHVFEPFSQADDGMTRSGGGLGLGLAISHQLVGAHGGTLTADSLGEAQGATFTLSLPVAAPVPVAERPPPRAAGLGGVQLLVVDDDARVRDALQLLLERAGAVVVTADSADAARAAMARALPDAVLSDLAMPGEDGYSFVRGMRQQPATRALPAVAITAHVTEGDRQRALTAGFDLYFTKPLNIDHLISKLAVLVETGRPSARGPR